MTQPRTPDRVTWSHESVYRLDHESEPVVVVNGAGKRVAVTTIEVGWYPPDPGAEDDSGLEIDMSARPLTKAGKPDLRRIEHRVFPSMAEKRALCASLGIDVENSPVQP